MSAEAEPLPPEDFRALLDPQLPRWNRTLPGPALDRVAFFLAELDRWRRSVNLTGRLAAGELVAHTLESLLGEPYLPRDSRAVDIGTGGGFPGVPLAIARPDVDMTWLEPREKRAAFLRHVARAVPVPNARVVVGRYEELADATFDAATSRAVKIDRASEAVRFLVPGGVLILWTTESDRLREDRGSAGLRLEQSIPIPESRHRQIVVFRKG